MTACEIKERIEAEIGEFIGLKCRELKEQTGLNVVSMDVLPRPMRNGAEWKGPYVRMTLT
ncbi:GnsA/GnsB family addiction module toxin [Hafnia alvei]|uniref:GnsA/GnsB family addiction module toxin n=1 Tax=Hafnia alvei TaxID=569 RepID=UPI00345D9C44